MHLYNGGLKPKAQCGNLLKGSQKIVLEKLQTLAFYFNRHIFQVLRTGGTSISGILPKLGPMRLFWELVRCEKYFGSGPAHMGVAPHPRFQLTE